MPSVIVFDSLNGTNVAKVLPGQPAVYPAGTVKANGVRPRFAVSVLPATPLVPPNVMHGADRAGGDSMTTAVGYGVRSKVTVIPIAVTPVEPSLPNVQVDSNGHHLASRPRAYVALACAVCISSAATEEHVAASSVSSQARIRRSCCSNAKPCIATTGNYAGGDFKVVLAGSLCVRVSNTHTLAG